MPSDKAASKDATTGLPDKGFLEVLDPSFKVRTAGEVWSVLLVDLYELEEIRGVHGRIVADRILQQTAYMLARNIKQSDEILLLDETMFALVLPSTNKSQAVNLALRLAGALKREQYPEGLKAAFYLGIGESSEQDRSLAHVVEKALKSLDVSMSMGSGRIAVCPGGDVTGGGEPSFDHFVDRIEQLALLRDALDSSISNGLSVILVTGAAGIGKTRLAGELAHYAGFRGCRMAITSPAETTISDARSLMGNILRSLTAGDAQDPIMQPGSGDPVSGIAAASSSTPLVIVIDDLHMAGSQDLEQIASMTRRYEDARILLVLLARSPLPAIVSEWLDTLELFAKPDRIELPPLSEESSADLVCLAVRASGLSLEEQEAIIAVGGGNPQNLEELVRHVRLLMNAADPEGAGRPGEKPRAMRMANYAVTRLNALGTALRRLLSAVSVIPWSFSRDEAAFVSDIDPAAASVLLEEALREGVLVRTSAAIGTPHFLFPCDAVRTALEPSGHEKRALLTRLGDFHSTRTEDAAEERMAAIGYLGGIDPLMALDHLLFCADDAAARSAGREREEWLGLFTSTAADSATSPPGLVQKCLELGELARRHGRRTAAMEHFLTASSMVTTPEESFHALMLRGNCLLESGDFISAETCFDRMQDLPSPSPEVAMTGRVALASLKHSMGFTAMAVGLLSDVEGWLEGGMEGLGGNHLRSEFLRTYGRILAVDGDPASGLGMCLEAAELSERSGDALGQVRALAALAGILSPGGSWEERYRILKRADRIARAAGDMEGLAGVWAELGSVHMSLNQIESAESYTDKAARLAEKVGCPALGVDSEIITGLAEIHRGEKESALRRFSSALERAHALGDARSCLICSMNAARILGAMGSHAQARALLGSLGPVGVPSRAGRRLHADLLFCSGVVEYQAASDSPEESAAAALSLIREARALFTPHDLLADLEASWYEALCLMDLGLVDEMGTLVRESCRTIGKLLEGVDSSFVREDFGRTDFIRGLLSLTGDRASGSPAAGR